MSTRIYRPTSLFGKIALAFGVFGMMVIVLVQFALLMAFPALACWALWHVVTR